MTHTEHEQALFDASVQYYWSLAQNGENSTITDEAHGQMLRAYNTYLGSGGTRGEAQHVIAEGRLQAAFNRRRAEVNGAGE